MIYFNVCVETEVYGQLINHCSAYIRFINVVIQRDDASLYSSFRAFQSFSLYYIKLIGIEGLRLSRSEYFYWWKLIGKRMSNSHIRLIFVLFNAPVPHPMTTDLLLNFCYFSERIKDLMSLTSDYSICSSSCF